MCVVSVDYSFTAVNNTVHAHKWLLCQYIGASSMKNIGFNFLCGVNESE